MRNLSRLLLIVLMPPAGMIAQTETFDIAALVPSTAWLRAGSSEMISLFDDSAESWEGSGQSGGGLEEYVFTAPPGWGAQQQKDGIVLVSPVYNNGERC